MHRKKRTFKQERAKETYEAILAAAARLFPKHGFDKTQVPDIAKAAGISTGAVYRYFEDKREIFLEMLERELEASRAEVEQRLTPERFLAGDARGAIAHVIDVFFAQAALKPALARVYLALSLTDKDVAAMRARTEAADRARVAALLRLSIPRERIPNPDAAALVIQTAALSVSVECAVFGTTPEGTTVDDVKEALVTALHRYVFGEGP